MTKGSPSKGSLVDLSLTKFSTFVFDVLESPGMESSVYCSKRGMKQPTSGVSGGDSEFPSFVSGRWRQTPHSSSVMSFHTPYLQ